MSCTDRPRLHCGPITLALRSAPVTYPCVVLNPKMNFPLRAKREGSTIACRKRRHAGKLSHRDLVSGPTVIRTAPNPKCSDYYSRVAENFVYPNTVVMGHRTWWWSTCVTVKCVLVLTPKIKTVRGVIHAAQAS